MRPQPTSCPWCDPRAWGWRCGHAAGNCGCHAPARAGVRSAQCTVVVLVNGPIVGRPRCGQTRATACQAHSCLHASIAAAASHVQVPVLFVAAPTSCWPGALHAGWIHSPLSKSGNKGSRKGAQQPPACLVASHPNRYQQLAACVLPARWRACGWGLRCLLLLAEYSERWLSAPPCATALGGAAACAACWCGCASLLCCKWPHGPLAVPMSRLAGWGPKAWALSRLSLPLLPALSTCDVAALLAVLLRARCSARSQLEHGWRCFCPSSLGCCCGLSPALLLLLPS